MKTLILVCAIVLPLILMSCSNNTDNDELIESTEGVLIDSEIQIHQLREENLVNRLQTAVESFANVNKAVINFDNSNADEKIVDVLVTAETNSQLTDDEKVAITAIIENSIGGDVTVNLNEE